VPVISAFKKERQLWHFMENVRDVLCWNIWHFLDVSCWYIWHFWAVLVVTFGMCLAGTFYMRGTVSVCIIVLLNVFTIIWCW